MGEGGGIGAGGREPHPGLGQVGGEEEGQLIGERSGGGLLEFGDAGGQGLNGLDGGGAAAVIAATVLFPSGEVVLVEGLAGKGGGGDGLDLGQGVQPGENGGVLIASLEAAIDLSAEGRRKKRDFHGNYKG